MLFHDRREAGRVLAQKLVHYANQPDVLVLALPRGGVPVAFEVARTLHAPLDVFVVRKLGVPGQEELAMGAIASGGALVLDEGLVRQLHIPETVLETVVAEETAELRRREHLYRGTRPMPPLSGRTLIVVDDGLATGASVRVALVALQRQNPARLVAAAPVGAPGSCAALTDIADEVVCARTPEPFQAVGVWYEDFSQTEDDEVRELLEEARSQAAPGVAGPP